MRYRVIYIKPLVASVTIDAPSREKARELADDFFDIAHVIEPPDDRDEWDLCEIEEVDGSYRPPKRVSRRLYDGYVNPVLCAECGTHGTMHRKKCSKFK